MDTGQFTHDTFISPFSWRYGSTEMRGLWSEHRKRLLLRRIWVALAKAQVQAGIVTPEQASDLELHQDDIDIERASAIEAEISHDLMAEIKTYAEQCPVGGPVIHLGATSMDVLDNMDALRLKDALGLIIHQTGKLLDVLAESIETYAGVNAMAYTHLQPAEPTTVGYRLAQYAQDLLTDYQELIRTREGIKGKGMKGAVGTSASYHALLEGTGMSAEDMEAQVMTQLGLEAFEVSTQVYPRKQDWLVLNALAGTAATLYRMTFDLRVLQSPPFGEWSEPFGTKQVGSSAMPFKRNPIHAEKVGSLARWIASLPSVAWNNAAHCLLERTLDDSANRRILLPEAFIAMDEILSVTLRIFKGLTIHTDRVSEMLRTYGVFAATEHLLMELGRRGADRQEMHEVIREHSLAAWKEVQKGSSNPLKQLLSEDDRITSYISASEVLAILEVTGYSGSAECKALRTAEGIRSTRRDIL